MAELEQLPDTPLFQRVRRRLVLTETRATVRRDPAAALRFHTGPHRYLISLLRDGLVDLMSGRMPVAPEMAVLSFSHLQEEAVVLVARWRRRTSAASCRPHP